jgi:hypothetical protein
MNNSIVLEDVSKKRGRKPKGGKITTSETSLKISNMASLKQNVIVHLKCSVSDLENLDENIKGYDSGSFLSYECLENEVIPAKHHPFQNVMPVQPHQREGLKKKEFLGKVKILDYHLHKNHSLNKNACCFWCTYDFENEPTYIPKYILNETFHVYGNFCSAQCAVGFLFNENIDASTRYERYYLLNHMYSDYAKNIKPAPNPFYMLEKFLGNLTIDEYRSLSKTADRMYILIDKPITKIMPEFHEDNDEYIITNKIIPSNAKNSLKPKLFSV